MSVNISGGLRKNAVSFIIILGSVMLLAAYLLVYLPSNEKKIFDRNFRELKSIANNTDLKFESLTNTGKNDLVEIPFKLSGTDTLYYNHDSLVYYKAVPGKKGIIKGDSLRNFFDDILDNNIFSEIAIIDTGGSTLYGSETPFPVFGRGDTLFSKKNLFLSGVVYNQHIYGEDYSIFILPYTLNKKLPLLICGFVPQSKIKAEKFSFPGSYVLILLSIIIYFIISLPFLKLLLLNGNELLSSYDLLFGLLGLTVGFSLTMFLIFDTYEFGIKDAERRDVALKKMADTISTEFEREIESAIYQLRKSDSIGVNFPEGQNHIHRGKINWLRTPDSIIVNQYYKNFIRTNWYNEKGELFRLWQNGIDSIKNPPLKKSFAKRDYYLAVKNNKLFQINRPDDKLLFGFQPLYSWIDKKFYTDISVKSQYADSVKLKNRPFVIDITAIMRSVTNTVLPPGYGFSIVNEKGKVQYHSNMRKNLRENILDECHNNDRLTEAIQTHSSDYFDASYERQPHRFYIRPVGQLPLFISVFYNQQVSYGTNLHIFGFYIIFISILIVLALFILAAILAKRYRKYSLLHRHKINIGWLWPKFQLRYIYLEQTLFNAILCVITCVIVFYSSCNPIVSFGILAYNVLISCCGYYLSYILEDDLKEEKGSGRVLLLASKAFPVSSFFLLLAGISYMTLKFTDSLGCFVFMGYVLVSIIVLCIILKVSSQRKLSTEVKKTIHFKRYSLMIFTWVILCFGVPSIRLFQDSFNLELINIVKYRQYCLAKSITESPKMDDPVFKSLDYSEKDSVLRAGIYFDDMYQDKIGNHESDGYSMTYGFTDQHNFDSLASFLRMHIGWIADDLQTPLIKSNSADTLRYGYSFNKATGLLELHYTKPVFNKNNPYNLIHLYSSLPVSRLFFFKNQDSSWGCVLPIMLWISIAAFLIMIFNLIYYFVKRVFDYSTYNEAITPHSPIILDKKILVLNSANFSEPGEHSLLEKYFKSKAIAEYPAIPYSDFEKIDFSILTDSRWELTLRIALNSEHKNLLVRNFDCDLLDKETNNRRIEALHRILKSGKQNIIIVSAVNPRDFKKIVINNAIEYDPDELTRFQKQVENLLATSLFIPEIVSGKMIGFKAENRSYMSKAIDYEMKYSGFLKNYSRAIIFTSGEIYTEDDLKEQDNADYFKDQVVIRIQIQAQFYYQWLWNNMTREEQFFLYDFASDGLMNFKNHSVIQSLSHKGILVVDGDCRRKIFNRSFRNFCLESLDKNQRLEFKEFIQNTGSWQKFKKPLLISILFIALFIFITQQDSFNTLIALLTTFTAGIPVILRFFTMFEGMGLKKP